MRFQRFLDIIPEVQRVENPGEVAHFKVMARQNSERLKALEEDPNPRLSAVAAIISPDDKGDAQFFLIERQSYNGTHSGQISFPGGKFDETDTDLIFTAKRESNEEIGIHEQQLKFIKELTKVYIPPSRFLMHPYMFASEFIPQFTINQREVKALVTLPLEMLLDDKVFEVGAIPLGNGVNIKTGYFKVQGYKVWGATALVLNEIKELIKPFQ